MSRGRDGHDERGRDGPGRDGGTPAAPDSAITRLLDRPIEQADLIARGHHAALPREPRSRHRAAFVIFRLGAELLALPVGVVRRALPCAPIRPIPHRTNDVLRGVCNVRGEIVLAADLRRLLGVAAEGVGSPPRSASPTNRMLVIDGTSAHRTGVGEPWAVVVDAVVGVERIDPASVRPAPSTVEHAMDAFAHGLADVAAGQVALLDAERTFAGLKAALR